MRLHGAPLAQVGRLASVVLLGLASPLLAQDDLAAAGEGVFRRCAGCHAVGEGAENKVGPHLNGLFGRTAGTLEGYTYSDAMVEAGAGGMVWGADTLTSYLAKPRDVVPGTKMVFAGLRKEEDIAAVIAYLEQAGGGAEPAGDGS